jgi:hypothetical protein
LRWISLVLRRSSLYIRPNTNNSNVPGTISGEV